MASTWTLLIICLTAVYTEAAHRDRSKKLVLVLDRSEQRPQLKYLQSQQQSYELEQQQDRYQDQQDKQYRQEKREYQYEPQYKQPNKYKKRNKGRYQKNRYQSKNRNYQDRYQNSHNQFQQKNRHNKYQQSNRYNQAQLRVEQSPSNLLQNQDLQQNTYQERDNKGSGSQENSIKVGPEGHKDEQDKNIIQILLQSSNSLQCAAQRDCINDCYDTQRSYNCIQRCIRNYECHSPKSVESMRCNDECDQEFDPCAPSEEEVTTQKQC